MERAMPRVALPQVLIVTGAMAAGKSTVAQGIAERLPRSVHLRGDVFRRMIVGGRRDPTPDAMEAWKAQVRLRYELSWIAADRYAREGFSVIYQDILGGALADASAALKAWRPGVVVLCPSPETLTQREAGRDKRGYKDGWTPHDLDAGLRAETPKVGLWLDTSAMTPAETVAAVFARAGKTRAGLPN
jgi:chloramphenicol 3-O-phosphotransferase